jgi:hypothetical protein
VEASCQFYTAGDKLGFSTFDSFTSVSFWLEARGHTKPKRMEMERKTPPLELSRSQIFRFRRRVGSLDERLAAGTKSLRRAAWAGLQDSMPRAALLSIHARMEGAHSTSWEHPSLVQLWGPRYSDYVVAAQDLPLFSLGRLLEDARRSARAQDTAARLHAFLDGRRMPFGQAGRARACRPTASDTRRRRARSFCAEMDRVSLWSGWYRRRTWTRGRRVSNSLPLPSRLRSDDARGVTQ